MCVVKHLQPRKWFSSHRDFPPSLSGWRRMISSRPARATVQGLPWRAFRSQIDAMQWRSLGLDRRSPKLHSFLGGLGNTPTTEIHTYSRISRNGMILANSCRFNEGSVNEFAILSPAAEERLRMSILQAGPVLWPGAGAAAARSAWPEPASCTGLGGSTLGEGEGQHKQLVVLSLEILGRLDVMQG